jgi:hypothetical protein
MGARTTGYCRELQEIKYVPLHSQYIHSLVLFVINNKNQFALNSEIHSINTFKQI